VTRKIIPKQKRITVTVTRKTQKKWTLMKRPTMGTQTIARAKARTVKAKAKIRRKATMIRTSSSINCIILTLLANHPCVYELASNLRLAGRGHWHASYAL